MAVRFDVYNYDDGSYVNSKRALHRYQMDTVKSVRGIKANVPALTDKLHKLPYYKGYYLMSGTDYNEFVKGRNEEWQLPSKKTSVKDTRADMPEIPETALGGYTLYGSNMVEFAQEIPDSSKLNIMPSINILNWAKEYSINMDPPYKTPSGSTMTITTIIDKLHDVLFDVNDSTFAQGTVYTKTVSTGGELANGTSYSSSHSTPIYTLALDTATSIFTTKYKFNYNGDMSNVSQYKEFTSMTGADGSSTNSESVRISGTSKAVTDWSTNKSDITYEYKRDIDSAYYKSSTTDDDEEKGYIAFKYWLMRNIHKWWCNDSDTYYLLTKDMLIEAITAIRDYYEDLKLAQDATVDNAKLTPIGNILKDANYLEGILEQEDLNKLDYFLVTPRISTMAAVNGYNDADIPSNYVGTQCAFSDIRDKDKAKLLHVIMRKDSKVVTTGIGDGAIVTIEYYYQVAGYVINWDAVRSSVNTINLGRLYTLGFTVDNHVHIPKKSRWVKVRTAVVVAVIVTVAIVTGQPQLAQIAWYTWAALGAVWTVVAAAATGSERWAKLSKGLGYAAMVGGAYEEGLTAWLSKPSTITQFTIQLAGMGMERKYRKELDKINDKIQALSDERQELEELVTKQECDTKVKKFIYEDSYSVKYEYDVEYAYKYRYV